MTNSHVIDYFVITAADLSALVVAWLVGKGWIEKKAEQTSGVNWQKSGHLYWLSSDLMWTWMQARDGNLPRLKHGLRKAVHHASSLGLNEPLTSRLEPLQSANAEKERLSDSEKALSFASLMKLSAKWASLRQVIKETSGLMLNLEFVWNANPIEGDQKNDHCPNTIDRLADTGLVRVQAAASAPRRVWRVCVVAVRT
jgi:hypothetical protein